MPVCVYSCSFQMRALPIRDPFWVSERNTSPIHPRSLEHEPKNAPPPSPSPSCLNIFGAQGPLQPKKCSSISLAPSPFQRRRSRKNMSDTHSGLLCCDSTHVKGGGGGKPFLFSRMQLDTSLRIRPGVANVSICIFLPRKRLEMREVGFFS